MAIGISAGTVCAGGAPRLPWPYCECISSDRTPAGTTPARVTASRPDPSDQQASRRPAAETIRNRPKPAGCGSYDAHVYPGAAGYYAIRGGSGNAAFPDPVAVHVACRSKPRAQRLPSNRLT